MQYLMLTLMIVFAIVCLFLILLVLIQKGRGGGLSSAFGGAGGNTAFGSKTGDVLTWATSVVFGIFLVLAVLLNLLANHMQKSVAVAPVFPTTVPVSQQPAIPGSEPTPAGTELPAAPNPANDLSNLPPVGANPTAATPAAPTTPAAPATQR